MENFTDLIGHEMKKQAEILRENSTHKCECGRDVVCLERFMDYARTEYNKDNP